MQQPVLERRSYLSPDNIQIAKTFFCNSLAAAAGTAWYSRQQIASTAANSQLWVTSHLEFVGVLWKSEALRERLEEVMELEDSNVQFHWCVSRIVIFLVWTFT